MTEDDFPSISLSEAAALGYEMTMPSYTFYVSDPRVVFNSSKEKEEYMSENKKSEKAVISRETEVTSGDGSVL